MQETMWERELRPSSLSDPFEVEWWSVASFDVAAPDEDERSSENDEDDDEDDDQD